MNRTSNSQNSPETTGMNLALERSIKNIGIPPCPAILTKVIDETSKDEPDYHYLSELISTDVALSAGLIKIANSAYFGARQRARSVREALTIIGLRAASRAIASIVLRNAFPHNLVMERFWDGSARIARLSGWMAQQLSLSSLTPEDAYTFGLFRDCGIPILLNHLPGYDAILAQANNEPVLSFTNSEDSALQTNHAEIGSKLAQDWRLPAEINLAIRQHHELKMLDAGEARLPHLLLSSRLIAIAQLSEHILQRQLGLSLTQEWSKLGTACLQLLEISDVQLEQIYLDAQPVATATMDEI
jgi:HD-like signal output (HDOD) protein